MVMRYAWSAAAVAVFISTGAQAKQTASDVAEAWATPASCYGDLAVQGGAEAGTVYDVEDDGSVRVAQVQVRIAGDRLSIIDDRKIEYYRILGPDKVEYVGYDKRGSEPATRTRSAVSRFCG
jgi:hypothetical protein